MKKAWVFLLAGCLAIGMTAMAQEAGKSCDMGKNSMGNSKMAAPLKTLKGTVKQEGDKITFVDIHDKSWDVINPEKLKDHVGHHVTITAHVYADKDQIHVMTVKMAKAASSM
ncbi:MAG TPA: hypothetical protein VLW06_09480 [Terriglobales bacterium]|nr:hypothetical protein [Terriglobales bacterium]